MIEQMKAKFCLSYECLARKAGISCATLMRWKRRRLDGRPAVAKRGPKKVQPLDLAERKERIHGLDHKRKRSRATGGLYRAYAGAISRRDLNAMVRQVREDKNRQERSQMSQITWLRANLAWAMDDCRKNQAVEDGSLYLHNLTDLGSRYRLPPLASHSLPCGEEVAGHLQHLFDRFDPPLFCKRDNGGNLNHTSVNEVLEQALVIPINSPAYRAPYNGAIEHTQGEFKAYLKRWAWKADTVDRLSLLAETAAHDLNHQPRRCLGGRTACRVYFGERRVRYASRERKSAYQRIRDLAAEVSLQAGKRVIAPLAWRLSARRWLLENGLIKIQKAGNVSPIFSRKLCHN